MSAVKIILKRSSIPGKRPNSQLLEAGELGLNTNAVEPGIYFETNDGNIVKAGPTAYLSEPPTVTPAKGESWLDSDTKVLSVGTDNKTWQPVASPFLGGTNGYTVFVAPDYEYATDSLKNDGQAVPFVTINRAILEVSKLYIQDIKASRYSDRRYTIFLLNGQHSVYNAPGTSVNDFSVNFENGDDSSPVSLQNLIQFNHPTGGLILPAGISIVGLDQKKSILRPNYIPKYTHPLFPVDYKLTNDGPVYNAQPKCPILRWTGSSYASNFSFTDKLESREVISITPGPAGLALFRTLEDHNLGYNDAVYVDYTNQSLQVGNTFQSGLYYVNIQDSRTFYLSTTSLTGENGVFTGIPITAFSLALRQTRGELLTVGNIYPYYRPANNQDYYLSNYSAHRLSGFGSVSLQDLNDFYIKVQKAFPETFEFRVNAYIAQPYETEYVAPTDSVWPQNLSSNSTISSSPYADRVSVRSNFGMSFVDFDGDIVSGFRSIVLNEATCVALQRDPSAYEIYGEGENDWKTLTELVSTELNTPLTSTPVPEQLKTLNITPIPNIRYYYSSLLSPTGESLGLPDPETDFRHFGIRVSGANAYAQVNSAYSIGCAVGAWAVGGASIALTNSTTNFGNIAFLSEGFAGIGTKGGASANLANFNHTGVYLPLALSEDQVRSDSQKDILPLGSVALFAELDPLDAANTQLIYLSSSFDPASILPYSLAPGSAVYIKTDSCVYRAYFVTDGSPTVVLSSTTSSCGNAILRVRSWDSQVPNDSLNGVPYIRRFRDPRSPEDRSYGFLLESTAPGSIAPSPGLVFRLNLSSQTRNAVIKTDKQLDPGIFGGFGQTFITGDVITLSNALSANFNNKISDASQATSYVVYPGVVDFAIPWTQVVSTDGGNVSLNLANGFYSTFAGKNYYAAENDEWKALYYSADFSTTSGPAKANPGDAYSPWVVSNQLIRSESVSTTYQGSNGDPFLSQYSLNHIENPTYLRGSTPPIREFTTTKTIDSDDGTNSFGIIYRKLPTEKTTTLLTGTTVYQNAEDISYPPPFLSTAGTIGRPQIDEFTVALSTIIRDPREGPSVILVSSPDGLNQEYMRVVLSQNAFYRAIRNYYPEYLVGTYQQTWPAGSIVTVCQEGVFPEPNVYDSDWSYTKFSVLRFLQLMGYPSNTVLANRGFTPQPYGLRKFSNDVLPPPQPQGYANYSTAWPVEFNQPSVIAANTHTWEYAGFFDYSRGLPKYQTSLFPRKLQYDYYGSVNWGGRISVAGVVTDGDLVFLGPVKEAQTGNYYLNENPELNFSNRTFYQSPEPVKYPNQILIFNCDDFSNLFNGVDNIFPLTVEGVPVPPSRLLTKSVFVTLGGVQQLPSISYTLSNSEIVFSEPPQTGTTVAVKVVTSDDEEESLTVIPLSLYTPPNGSTRLFELIVPSEYRDLRFTQDNVFVSVGGIQQIGGPNPLASYNISFVNNAQRIFFVEPPATDSNIDIRAFVTGPIVRSQGQTIQIVSLDDISYLFDGTTDSFELRQEGQLVNPNLVTEDSTIVQLGGVIQEPPTFSNPDGAYTIDGSVITFSQPPIPGASADIRVILSNSNLIIACPNPPEPYSNA